MAMMGEGVQRRDRWGENALRGDDLFKLRFPAVRFPRRHSLNPPTGCRAVSARSAKICLPRYTASSPRTNAAPRGQPIRNTKRQGSSFQPASENDRRLVPVLAPGTPTAFISAHCGNRRRRDQLSFSRQVWPRHSRHESHTDLFTHPFTSMRYINASKLGTNYHINAGCKGPPWSSS